MRIHQLWDSSALARPDFQAMVVQVCNDIAAQCPGDIDATIQFGWGTIMGGVQVQFLGESAANGGVLVPYSVLRSAALARNPSLILPTTDPNPTGAPCTVNPLLAKQLGLKPNDLALDGWCGFESTPGVITFDRSNLNGQFDGYGVIAHEITEVMNRSMTCSTTSFELLDLLHYSGPNVPRFTMDPGYLSLDGGNTPIHWYNTVSGADAGDWRGDDIDPFNAFASSGVLENISNADWTMILSALCYGTAGAPPPPPPPAISCTLTASPSSLKTPGHTTLSWTSNGATSWSMDNGVIMPQQPKGSITVSVASSMTFKLTVSGPGGIAGASTTVIVHKSPHPHRVKILGRRR